MTSSSSTSSKKKVDSHILRKYELSEIIGEGAYGIVWKATEKKTRKVVALKKVFDAFRNSTDSQRTYREVMLLLNLSHTNIVKLNNVYRAKNDLDFYMIFEYIESNLHSVIRAGILEEIHQRYIIYQLCKVLKYLHAGHLIHRDIKPANILIDTHCKLTLADFGLARTIKSLGAKDTVFTEYIASRWWRAPEILTGCKQYAPAVDMWAVGCVLGEMILGKPLFRGTSTVNQLQRILQYIPKPTQTEINSIDSDHLDSMLKMMHLDEESKPLTDLLPRASKECIDFVQKLLIFDPAKRMTAEDTLKHPYLAEFHKTSSETVMSKDIRLYYNDDVRYKTNDYRERLYHVIRQLRRKRRKKQEAAKKSNDATTNGTSASSTQRMSSTGVTSSSRRVKK
uniref:Mitogen-activated protein kinase n=1 Tax=Percolomonas cosmopolitus TaxID=63605 RepID=A0A7S1KQP0_9EUKA